MVLRCKYLIDADVAQQVAHFHGKEEVVGSNPIIGTKCECGGTGRHNGLKIRRVKSCWFESSHSHQMDL